MTKEICRGCAVNNRRACWSAVITNWEMHDEFVDNCPCGLCLVKPICLQFCEKRQDHPASVGVVLKKSYEL